MRNKNLGTIGVIFGIVGIGYAMYTTAKANKVCNKIDKTLDEICYDTDIDIPEEVVNAAIERAVDREVNRAVESAVNRTVREIKHDIHGQVKDAVTSTYSDIKERVAKEVSQEIANIDMASLKSTVTRHAEEKIVDKFDGNLDELLLKFNQKLESINSIYESIANTIAKRDTRETVFRIS